ncbi:hypothetical protein FQA39_LY02042 [Lamprigera yunnana]|nr:hypothetical protein FQA39_LY02042 [Lamprigera yunnana]
MNKHCSDALYSMISVIFRLLYQYKLKKDKQYLQTLLPSSFHLTSKFKQVRIETWKWSTPDNEKIFENVNHVENVERKETDANRAQKNLTQQCCILRGIVSDILEEVRSIKKSLCGVERTPDDNAATTSYFNQSDCQFPLNLEEYLTIFNQFLEEEENFKNAVTELSRVGGSTTYSFVSKTLKLILTNELPLSYSWLSRKGKKVFKTLKVVTLIIECTTVAIKEATRQDIKQSIQLLVRRAFD